MFCLFRNQYWMKLITMLMFMTSKIWHFGLIIHDFTEPLFILGVLKLLFFLTFFRIKISMLPSLLRSPGTASASHLNQRILVTSPLSSAQQTPVSAYHRTPVLRSPVSPYIQSPFARPTLSASPGSSLSNSPATYSGAVSSSPSSHRVIVNLLCKYFPNIFNLN